MIGEEVDQPLKEVCKISLEVILRIVGIKKVKKKVKKGLRKMRRILIREMKRIKI